MATVVHFKPSADQDSEPVNIEEGQSLLDGLLQNGYDIPFGCKGGVCQSCLLQSPSSNIPAPAQVGLSQAQKDQGLLLSCSCMPVDQLEVQHIDLSGEQSSLKVIEKFALSDDIFCLRLTSDIQYKAGQFMTLWKDDKTARSYSIASVCNVDNYIEFHIKRIEDGAFSSWAWHNLNVGDSLKVQGPLGQCYYTEVSKDTPILLAGIGTGLAPLVGIVRDALRQKHSGEISLFVGAQQARSFYLVNALTELASTYNNFNVTFVALDTTSSDSTDTVIPSNALVEGDIYQTLKETFPTLNDFTIYLCGAESFVRKLKKQCFLAGASMKAIYSDPFIPFGGN